MFTRTLLVAGGTLILAGSSLAQNRYLFSVNWHGPTVGTPAISGVAITEGDILWPSSGTANPALGLLPAPTIGIDHVTSLGLPPICVGHPGGTPCIVEVDAFSRGVDRAFMPNQPIAPGDLLFSVDEFARGFAFGAGPLPNLTSEALAREAATDAFTNLVSLPPGPVTPFPGRNIGVVDGDGPVLRGSRRGHPVDDVGRRQTVLLARTGDGEEEGEAQKALHRRALYPRCGVLSYSWGLYCDLESSVRNRSSIPGPVPARN